MRVLLAIGMLLVFGAPSVAFFFEPKFGNRTKRATTEEVGKFTEALNRFRKNLAETYQVANMYEIRYDMDLERQAEKVKTCNDVVIGSNFVPYLTPTPESWGDLRNFRLGSVEDMIKGKDTLAFEKFGFVLLLTKQLMHPLQTRVGCFELETPCYSELDQRSQGRYGVQKIAYEGICYLGPSISDSEYDVKQGPPGSQCDTGNAMDGLCISNSEYINFHDELGIGANAQSSTSKVYSYFIAVSLVIYMIFHR